MSATVIAFPSPVTTPSRDASRCTAPIAATALAAKMTDHFLPVVQASVDLLEADNHEVEARCRSMLDSDGMEMVDDLCREFEIVGRQLQILVDGLQLTRSRLRTAMANLTVEAI